jgi:hypothetical protein
LGGMDGWEWIGGVFSPRYLPAETLGT